MGSSGSSTQSPYEGVEGGPEYQKEVIAAARGLLDQYKDQPMDIWQDPKVLRAQEANRKAWEIKSQQARQNVISNTPRWQQMSGGYMNVLGNMEADLASRQALSNVDVGNQFAGLALGQRKLDIGAIHALGGQGQNVVIQNQGSDAMQMGSTLGTLLSTFT